MVLVLKLMFTELVKYVWSEVQMYEVMAQADH